MKISHARFIKWPLEQRIASTFTKMKLQRVFETEWIGTHFFAKCETSTADTSKIPACFAKSKLALEEVQRIIQIELFKCHTFNMLDAILEGSERNDDQQKFSAAAT